MNQVVIVNVPNVNTVIVNRNYCIFIKNVYTIML